MCSLIQDNKDSQALFKALEKPKDIWLHKGQQAWTWHELDTCIAVFVTCLHFRAYIKLYAEAFGTELPGSKGCAKVVGLAYNVLLCLVGTTIDGVEYKCLNWLRNKICLALRSCPADIRSNCNQRQQLQQQQHLIRASAALVFKELNEDACLISWSKVMCPLKQYMSRYVRGGPHCSNVVWTS